MDKPARLQRSPVRILAAALLAAALCGTATTPAWASDDAREDRDRDHVELVGSWKFMVTFTNCANGAAVRAPFPALNSFFADGNAIENGAAMPPSLRSISHGRWQRTGRLSFIARSEMQLFESAGLYIGYQLIERRFDLAEDGNSLVSTARFTRTGIDGSVTFRGCATETGVRQPEPVWP